MNNVKLNTALYQTMEREQDKYRKWLVQCPPEEILSHAYEYVVREDILMSMEELNLPDDQAMALLKQRGPLDDVFKDFSKLEGAAGRRYGNRTGDCPKAYVSAGCAEISAA